MAVGTAMPRGGTRTARAVAVRLGVQRGVHRRTGGDRVAGGWADARGPARPLFTGLAVFVAGLLLVGTAPTMAWFVAGRAIQGFGSGMASVPLYVIVARVYPEELRPKIFAAMAGAWVVPSLVGPSIGGLVAQHARLAVGVPRPRAARGAPGARAGAHAPWDAHARRRDAAPPGARLRRRWRPARRRCCGASTTGRSWCSPAWPPSCTGYARSCHAASCGCAAGCRRRSPYVGCCSARCRAPRRSSRWR